MTASMFQGEGGYTSVVGEKPHPQIQALSQGSVSDVKSDLQNMMDDEKKRHMDQYIYENGHNDGSAALGTPSF
jgi:hypothetical protein